MYTIKQASLRSGVGVPLLRAWERRYGVVRPARTPAGYRLYDDQAIERLRAMRRLVEAGWAPREAAPRVLAADDAELRSLQPSTSFHEAALAPATPDSVTLVARIAQAAAAMDQERLEAALDETLAATRFEPAIQGVVLPAMVEVGAAWARGEMDVAAEHATSAAVLRRLGSAFQAAGGGAGAPTVLVGLPPGSHHELAALAFATVARRRGLNVVYLGPDVPLESWHASVEDTSAAAVVLGAVMRRDAGAAAAVFMELSARAPSLIRAAGGPYAGAIRGEGHLVLAADLQLAADQLREAIGS